MLESSRLSHLRPLLHHLVVEIDCHYLPAQVLFKRNWNLYALHKGLVSDAPKKNISINGKAKKNQQTCMRRSLPIKSWTSKEAESLSKS